MDYPVKKVEPGPKDVEKVAARLGAVTISGQEPKFWPYEINPQKVTPILLRPVLEGHVRAGKFDLALEYLQSTRFDFVQTVHFLRTLTTSDNEEHVDRLVKILQMYAVPMPQ